MKDYVMDARPWKRVVAFLFDSLVLAYLVISPFSKWILDVLPHNPMSRQIGGAAVVGLLLMFSFILLYFSLFDYLAGQSLGMMVMGIFTVGADRKSLPSFWQSIGRNLAVMPFFPIIILTVIDPVYLAIRKVRLSDVITSSFVVERAQYLPR